MSKRGTGAINVQRRTWDKAEYEAKAKERAEREAAGRFSDEEDGAKPAAAGGAGGGVGVGAPYRPAPEGAAGPEGSKRAFLSAREEQLNLETNLNKRSLITEATPSGAHGGYHCPTCECTLKDSEAYLDHINGKRHQRKLGYSMRVEAASVEAVRARIDYWRQKHAQEKNNKDTAEARAEAVAEYEARIAKQEEEEQRRKRARKEKGKGGEGNSGAARDSTAPPGTEQDPDAAAMAAMMGFTGFSSSAKA